MSRDSGNGPWNEIEPGMLVQLSEREKSLHAANRRARRISTGVAAVVASCMVAVVGFYLLPSDNGPDGGLPPYGGIACDMVLESQKAFFAGTLPRDLGLKIEKHLEDCVGCRQAFQSYASEVGSSVDRAAQQYSVHMPSIDRTDWLMASTEAEIGQHLATAESHL